MSGTEWGKVADVAREGNARMPVTIETQTASRIAELLDLFAELPSTPPVLTDEARNHAVILLDLIEEEGEERIRRPDTAR